LLSTLAIALLVWLAGAAIAVRFGSVVDSATSFALIAFGGWIAVSAWRELHGGAGQGHSHRHDFGDPGGTSLHGPELQRISTDHGELLLSIYETATPPRFRLTGAHGDTAEVETLRSNGMRQLFVLKDHGSYWESDREIPEPDEFDVTITIKHDGHTHVFATQFAEHQHGHDHYADHDHGHEHELAPASDPRFCHDRA
jgi:nickel/cobalt exporter